MAEDTFLRDIRELVEIRLAQLQSQANPGERWIRYAPSELVQTYLSLKILERLESIDETPISILNSPGDKP